MAWSRPLWLAGLLLSITVVVRLPAAWAAHWLPAGVQCVDPGGTLWQGACGRVQTTRFYLENLQWSLAPSALLRGRLSGRVSIADPRLSAQGEASYGLGGELWLRDFKADVDLSRRNFPQLHADVIARVHLQIASLSLPRGQLPAISGTARILELHRESKPEQVLGSYEVAVDQPAAGAAKLEAAVRDLAGPLALSNARISVSAHGEYEADGLVAARPLASEELKRLLEVLGPPDAAGRRPFTLAGSY